MRDRRTRAVTLLVAAVLVAGAGLWAWDAFRPLSADEQERAARELLGQIEVTAGVHGSSLAVTRAVADFGLEQGVRMVPVRIVEELTIALRIETDREIVLAGPPRICLVGPFWNPLDAGLSDRCWGDPDLGTLAAERLLADAAGRVVLRPGEPLSLEATLARGDERCDYAPGEWRLEVDALAVVDGTVQPRLDIADVPVELPLETGGRLPFRPNSDTRFCSYTAAIYVRQGEPSFVAE